MFGALCFGRNALDTVANALKVELAGIKDAWETITDSEKFATVIDLLVIHNNLYYNTCLDNSY